MRPLNVLLAMCLVGGLTRAGHCEPLRAGTARVNITDREAGKVHDPCFAKALVLQAGKTTAVLVTVDSVSIGELGRNPERKYILGL